MERKKILIIDNSTDITGAVKSILTSSYDLRPYYDFVWLIPKDSKSIKMIESEGFNLIHTLKMVELKRSILTVLVYLPTLFLNSWRLRTIIKKERISLIHVNDIYNLLPVSLRLLGISVPYICHIRFLPNRFPRILFKSWLQLHKYFASEIICVSESVRKLLPIKIQTKVIYNEFPLRQKYPTPTERISRTFLYLANYISGKGQDLALRAFSIFNANIPGWRIRFVGSDMGLVKNRIYFQGLKKLSTELDIDHLVEWSGFTDDVEKEYKSATIALNFSESESFSITCLEAMYFGIPLIASDCGGPAEIIDNNITGILVENKDVVAMANAMIKVAIDDKGREEMARMAVIEVKERFSRSNTTYKLLAVYRSILS